MPCEHYKDAVIEAAVSGAAPSGELRVHLSECASCRSAFDEEQSLFAAIDSGLHADANAEVPRSLLPRVRASLNEAALAHPRWSSGWFALAGTAVAAATVLLVVTTRQNTQRTPANLVANRTPAQQILPSVQGASSPALSKKWNSIPRTPISIARNSGTAVLVNNKPTPEILVPRDQEPLLVSYAQEWGSRKRAPLVAGDVAQAAVTPLEVAPIQILQLDVKPLTEEASK